MKRRHGSHQRAPFGGEVLDIVGKGSSWRTQRCDGRATFDDLGAGPARSRPPRAPADRPALRHELEVLRKATERARGRPDTAPLPGVLQGPASGSFRRTCARSISTGPGFAVRARSRTRRIEQYPGGLPDSARDACRSEMRKLASSRRVMKARWRLRCSFGRPYLSLSGDLGSSAAARASYSSASFSISAAASRSLIAAASRRQRAASSMSLVLSSLMHDQRRRGPAVAALARRVRENVAVRHRLRDRPAHGPLASLRDDDGLLIVFRHSGRRDRGIRLHAHA